MQNKHTAGGYEGLIDRRIAAAREDGVFTNLPGEGQPQQFADDSLVPDELRAGHRLLAANDVCPPWMEARKAVDAARTEVERWLSEAKIGYLRTDADGRTALRREYRQRLEGVQRMVCTYNLSVPPVCGQMPGIQIDVELKKLGAR